jgi:hypothetical protein
MIASTSVAEDPAEAIRIEARHEALLANLAHMTVRLEQRLRGIEQRLDEAAASRRAP